MAVLTDIQALAEAKSARHKLLTGRAIAEFRDSNGETVRYNKADLPALGIYISELEGRIAAGGAASRNVGPMRVLM